MSKQLTNSFHLLIKLKVHLKARDDKKVNLFCHQPTPELSLTELVVMEICQSFQIEVFSFPTAESITMNFVTS